jgi:hypothetical protein
MRLALRLFCLLLFAVPPLLATALWLAVDRHPVVNRTADITPGSIERAKRIFDASDPRRLPTGARRTISLSQGDLDLAANYLVQQYASGSARVILQDDYAQVTASVPLPKVPCIFMSTSMPCLPKPLRYQSFNDCSSAACQFRNGSPIGSSSEP